MIIRGLSTTKLPKQRKKEAFQLPSRGNRQAASRCTQFSLLELTSRARNRAGSLVALSCRHEKRKPFSFLKGEPAGSEPLHPIIVIGVDLPRSQSRGLSGCTFLQIRKKEAFQLPLKGNRQRPILPGRVQPSTFGTGELNYCVRYGNRWDLSVITTGRVSGAQQACFLPKSFRSTLTTAQVRFNMRPLQLISLFL